MTFLLKINPKIVAKNFDFKIETTTQLQGQKNDLPLPKTIKCLVKDNGGPYICMWCSIETNCPVGLPVEHINSKKKISQVSATTGDVFHLKENSPFEPEYKTFGVFCSIQCAYAFWAENRHKTQFALAGFLLHQIWRIEFGANGPQLESAPPRESLKIFGGFLDHTAFHTRRDFKFYHVKMFFSPLVFEQM